RRHAQAWPPPRSTSAGIAPGDGVEHEGHCELDGLVAIEAGAAERPIAQRAEDRPQHELREGVCRNVGADLAARLRELDQRPEQGVRRGDGQSLAARADLEDGPSGELTPPGFPAHDGVEECVQRLAEGGTRDQIGQQITREAQALKTILQQQILLVLEVEIEGGLRDPGRGDDRFDGRFVHPVAQEEGIGGFPDAGPRHFPTGERRGPGAGRSRGLGVLALFPFPWVRHATRAISHGYRGTQEDSASGLDDRQILLYSGPQSLCHVLRPSSSFPVRTPNVAQWAATSMRISRPPGVSTRRAPRRSGSTWTTSASRIRRDSG